MAGELRMALHELLVKAAADPDTEIAAAARGYLAYCGTYDFRGGTVGHRVALSLMPNLIGGEQCGSSR
jgi:hypothetical protein